MKLPKNAINISILVDQDTDSYDINVKHNLSVTMKEDQATYYLDVVNGILSKLKNEMQTFAYQGALLRELSILREFIEEEDDEDDICFEPDEELVEAMKKKNSGKVIDFKKPKIH